MRPGVAFLFSVISGAISIFGGIPSRAIASERSLTDAQIAGQHVIFPFNGSTPPSWLVHRIRRGEAAGVLLFAGNGTSAVTVGICDTGIDADVIVQLAAGVGGHVAEPLYLGVRLRGVGSALGRTLTGIDVTGAAASEAVVFSAEPWVRLRFDPVQVTLRASVSFNGADGVGGDRAPPFGVFVGVGGEAD